jgi:hypothetical protein
LSLKKMTHVAAWQISGCSAKPSMQLTCSSALKEGKMKIKNSLKYPCRAQLKGKERPSCYK